MTHREVRQKFIDFFIKRGHTEVPSSSLIPDGDSSVLFTTAGMQQFKPYYTKAKDPIDDFNSKNTTSIQKCMRTSDIDEVGDETHLTFFEMLGNFSFGGYFKKEAIEHAYEFITKEMGLTIDYVSVFEGDENIPADIESEEIWKNLDPAIEVRKFGKEDNFWGPTGEEGPCGPTTEIYVKDVEVWNVVFNEYYKTKDGEYRELEQKGIDTGMGLERLLVMVQNKNSIFETDAFASIMASLPSGDEKSLRIVSDHVRSAVFLISDGVTPSNTEQGYILRRLLRSAIRHAKNLGVENLEKVARTVIAAYGDYYMFNEEEILSVIKAEEDKFGKTLEKGLREFEKGSRDAFVLFTTYGFPIEMTQELATEVGESIDVEEFNQKMADHQTKSKTSAEGKFKGGLAGSGEMEIKYHTATHMLNQALREVLGNHVNQKGSNITSERLRFDFSHSEKMTDDEKKRVEDLINEKIEEDLPVFKEEMTLDQARDAGALGVFGDKYGETVDVYQIGKGDDLFSKEICGGPHVESTGSLGKFRIKKEEASSAGVRRIKAVLE